MSKKCKAYSRSGLGLELPDSRKAFYAGWDAALPAQPAPVQPVAWLEILRNNRTATDEVIGAFLRGHAEHLTGETFVLTTPPAQPAPVQPVQEPFGYAAENIRNVTPVYTTPPAAQRQWVGLTDEEKRQIFEREDYQGWLDYINAIEAKLKEKNT
jgi:hypothetical protein